MRLSDDKLILGVAAGLALAVTLVVTHTRAQGKVELLAQTPAVENAAAAEPGALEVPGSSVADSNSNARTRASEAGGNDIPRLDAERRRDGRRREAELLAEFTTLRKQQGDEAFERALRAVLASKVEPQERKVASLRALHLADFAGTVALLAASVENQADVSDGSGPSVPRCALKLLYERAPASEAARRALVRLAFIETTRASAELRRSASSYLSASIHVPQRDEAVRLLRLEATPAELAPALEALAHDANFGAAGAPLK
jgi:hypothetical protein